MDSSEIDPNSSTPLGNTLITKGVNKAKQSPSRKNHFFTYNNYTEEEIDLIVSTLKRFAYKGKIQSEIGENGTKHLQGMIWCKDKHRDTEFKLSKSIHWETLKDVDNIRDYCGKDETYDGLFRISWGFPKPLKLINPTLGWQKNILEIIAQEPDDRKVYWFWENRGNCGKSSFCKYLVAKHNAIFIDEGKKADIMHIMMEADMDESNLVIFDVPRDNGNNVSYKAIESIKNGMIFSPKYESKSKLFNSPHVIIFANEPPETSKLSLDRWEIVEITEYYAR